MSGNVPPQGYQGGPGQGPQQGFDPNQQQWQQAGPPPKKKKPIWKRWWFIVIAVLVLLGILGNLAGGSDEPAATPTSEASESAAEAAADPSGEAAGEESAPEEQEPAETEEAAEEPAGPAVGQQFEAGDWGVTIVAVEDPVAKVGSEYMEEEAQGVFIPVKLEAVNNSNEAEYFWADEVKLIDSQDREFSYSSDAAVWGEGGFLLEEINPGNTIKGYLWFDVPEGTELKEIQVSDGIFSKPISVAIN